MTEMHVLLVENSPADARLVETALANEDVRLTHVESLGDAIRAVAEVQPDAVLFDPTLPDGQGVDGVERMREASDGVPIVVLTGSEHAQLGTEALRRGAQDYLTKSNLSGDLLLRTLHVARERQRISTALERSNEDLQRFAYVASHDLQEPLRMVKSYLQLLSRRYEGQLDDTADEFIAFAVDGAERMQRLIDGLLTYSRVQTKGRAFGLTDCEAALDDALKDLELAVEDSGAAITRDALPHVTADRAQLTQLLQNLIGNAIKFRGEVPPEIDVSARRDDGEWVFSVRDKGIGVPAERADEVFTMFRRLHGTAEYPGAGIGLAVCRRIVERHGGRIWLESPPGGGTTFCFTIPDQQGEQQAA